jgi:hypothetical protein
VRWRALVLVVVAVTAGAPPADACQCRDAEVQISGHPGELLPPDPTLYLLVPEGTSTRDPITATQRGRELAVDTDELLRNAIYSVRRLRIRGTAPGTLEVAYARHGEPARYHVGGGRSLAVPRLRSAQFDATGTLCGESHGFDLALSGTSAAIYRLRWRDDRGRPRQAYLPPRPAYDDRGVVRNDHEVFLGTVGCGTPWFDPTAFDRPTDVELTMLGFGGEEVALAHGALYLGERSGRLPMFDAVDPAPPAAVAPVRSSLWASWAAAGIAIGIVLGASAMSIDLARRRRA